MNSGARVRALRVALGHSQSALAALTGVLDQSYINKIESGRNKASTHHVRSALARAFRLSWEDLASYLEGGITLKAALARMSSDHVSEPLSTTPPSIHDDTIVVVPGEAGSTEQVPLQELIRVYRIATQQRGTADGENVVERLEMAEARMQRQARRLEALEEMLAKVEVRLAEAGLSSKTPHSAKGKTPNTKRSSSR